MLPLHPPVTHLLFDLDGTLVGNRNFPLSFEFIQRSLRALRKYGGWIRAVRALAAIQKEFRVPSSDLTNDQRVLRRFAAIFKIDDEEARKILRENLFFIFPKLERHFFPMPGSGPFIDWARGRFPLFLATNPVWPPEIIELRVRWAGIDPASFTGMSHVRRMHFCKPRREYYEEILEQEGLNEDQCLLIGNDLKMDLPATEVGIRVFIVVPQGPLREIQRPAGHALAWSGTYTDLRDLLEQQ